MNFKFLIIYLGGILCWGTLSFAGKHPRSLEPGETRSTRIHYETRTLKEDIKGERKRPYEEGDSSSRNMRHQGPKVPEVLPEHKNFLQAFQLMRLQEPEGHYKMGLLQVEGKGHQNHQLALEVARGLFEKAAHQGYIKAYKMLSYVYQQMGTHR